MKRLIFLLLFLYQFACAQDKWIVVTTINYPTEALKKLVQLKDWRMVVVADKKTPKDWQLQGCDFLSVERQEKLGFSINQCLPWNHYSRKNIGYLYAIKNGAQIIYETDDDNCLIDNQINYLKKYSNIITVAAGADISNPYAYFGQETVWPRGYPLHKLFDNKIEYKNEKGLLIPIQQGLVNNDPDVDAIFRLTRKQEINFEDKEPLALAHGCMAPFNSQNTLFHYEAFWGLLIPKTVSFRVSDIWRGYWTQRILWDIGANLCFLSPTAIQYRNEHNLLNDFIDEYDLYTKSEDLIMFLKNWRSTKNILSNRIVDLFDDLIENKFFQSDEKKLVEAWLADLEQCGYTFPQIID